MYILLKSAIVGLFLLAGGGRSEDQSLSNFDHVEAFVLSQQPVILEGYFINKNNTDVEISLFEKSKSKMLRTGVIRVKNLLYADSSLEYNNLALYTYTSSDPDDYIDINVFWLNLHADSVPGIEVERIFVLGYHSVLGGFHFLPFLQTQDHEHLKQLVEKRSKFANRVVGEFLRK